MSLFEKGQLMQATSSASSKLLHGAGPTRKPGRSAEFASVERDNWLARTPHLAQPAADTAAHLSHPGRVVVGPGLAAYDLLAGHTRLPKSVWLNTQEVLGASGPKRRPLLGGYHHDRQMDDRELGLGVARQCRADPASTCNKPPRRACLHTRARFILPTTKPKPSIASSTPPGPVGQLLSREHRVGPRSWTPSGQSPGCRSALPPCPAAGVPAHNRVFFHVALEAQNPDRHQPQVRQSLTNPSHARKPRSATYLCQQPLWLAAPAASRNPFNLRRTFAAPVALGDNPSRASREYGSRPITNSLRRLAANGPPPWPWRNAFPTSTDTHPAHHGLHRPPHSNSSPKGTNRRLQPPRLHRVHISGRCTHWRALFLRLYNVFVGMNS